MTISGPEPKSVAPAAPDAPLPAASNATEPNRRSRRATTSAPTMGVAIPTNDPSEQTYSADPLDTTGTKLRSGQPNHIATAHTGNEDHRRPGGGGHA